MWVRTQDKMQLVKINEIHIKVDEDGFVGIWVDDKKESLKYFLGTYKSKERAIEVLDEIQKLFILNILKHKGYDYKNLIYENKDTLVEHLQNELDDKNMEIEHLKEEIKNIIQDRDDNFRRLGDEELL